MALGGHLSQTEKQGGVVLVGLESELRVKHVLPRVTGNNFVTQVTILLPR